MRVILISGKAEHGKDYVGNMIVKYLQSQGKRVMVMHFADMLKYCCKQYMGWDGNKDEAGRRILQQVGTDWRIGRNERIWADMTVMIAQHFSEQFDYCIVPDWRFIIEYNTFCDSFGKKNVTTLRVIRYEDENYW